jgi:predicted GIY-YIG superfamily endonuclease
MRETALNEFQLERFYKSKKKPPNYLELNKVKTSRGLEIAVGNLVYIVNYEYKDDGEHNLDTFTVADLMKMTERDFHILDLLKKKGRKEIKDNSPYFVDLITFDPHNKIQLWVYLSDERGNEIWAMGGLDEVSPDRVWKVERISDPLVYFIQESTGLIKIGLTKNIGKRLKTYETHNPHELKLLKVVRCANLKEAQHLEKSLHKKFSKFKINGEWFELPEEIVEGLLEKEQ